MENIKGIIFDFNGTLFFDNDKHEKAWNKISLELRGKEITQEELHGKLNGTPNDRNIAYLTDGKATLEEVKKYSLLKEEYYRDFCKADRENFHLVQGVVEYWDKLKEQQIPFTIASASIKENIDFFRESFGWDDYIAPNLLVYDDGTYENKVAMFQDAADKIGIPMENILIYEDSHSGIRNAYTAGCKNIVVICADENRDEYMKFDGVIKTMEDFSNM